MGPSGIVQIGDEQIQAVPGMECGDPMVDLRAADSALRCDYSDLNLRDKGRSLFTARSAVGEKLEQAQRRLPIGLRLLIKECYRPLRIQKEAFDSYIENLRTK